VNISNKKQTCETSSKVGKRLDVVLRKKWVWFWLITNLTSIEHRVLIS